MPGVEHFELPIPKSEYAFEHMVLDIYSGAWHDSELNGRRGQQQSGVDMYGYPEGQGRPPAGIQCKRYYSTPLTQEHIKEEVAKAGTFVPALSEYIIATTTNRDAKLQEFVRVMNEERANAGKFTIRILFWEDICLKLNEPDNKSLLGRFLNTHYSGLKDVFASLPRDVATSSGDGLPGIEQHCTETVYSTLLPVERVPHTIYGAPCDLRNYDEVRSLVRWPDADEFAPFTLREGKLFTFQDLTRPSNPFRHVIKPKTAEKYLLSDWINDPDRLRWYVELLSSALRRLMTVRGLAYDKNHKRYYFRQEEAGQEKEISYQPLNNAETSRHVVWQPKSKKTGLPRGEWFHLALSPKFHKISGTDWALSLRPELHITVDGVQPLRSDKIGPKVTKEKSRTFNYDLLVEVNFWRSFLGERKPHIILRFGGQSLLIRTDLSEGEVTWPGIPEEHAKAFKNVHFVDDLFSWAERNEPDREHGEYWDDGDGIDDSEVADDYEDDMESDEDAE